MDRVESDEQLLSAISVLFARCPNFMKALEDWRNLEEEKRHSPDMRPDIDRIFAARIVEQFRRARSEVSYLKAKSPRHEALTTIPYD